MHRIKFFEGDLVAVVTGRYRGCDAEVTIPKIRYAEEDVLVCIEVITKDWPEGDRCAGVYQHRLVLVKSAASNPNSAFKRLKMSRQ